MTLAAKRIDSGDGRTFDLREINPGDMLDLIEAAGSASASDAWMRYAVMICSVEAIDGKPVMPTTKNAIRELGRRIGNAGMEALAIAIYPVVDQEERAVSEFETAKN